MLPDGGGIDMDGGGCCIMNGLMGGVPVLGDADDNPPGVGGCCGGIGMRN